MYLPQGYFGLLIADDGHEYKNEGSAQGQAMGGLARKASKALLLTGTLMGGYADDLFYLLYRLYPEIFIEDPFAHGRGVGCCDGWAVFWPQLERRGDRAILPSRFSRTHHRRRGLDDLAYLA